MYDVLGVHLSVGSWCLLSWQTLYGELQRQVGAGKTYFIMLCIQSLLVVYEIFSLLVITVEGYLKSAENMLI